MIEEIIFVFLIGFALMLVFNFAGRRFVPGLNQTTGQLLIISVVQAVLIVILIIFIF